MAVHVRCNKSLYIFLPSATKQQRKMTQFCAVQRRLSTRAIFFIFISNVSPCPRFNCVMVLTLKKKGKMTLEYREIRGFNIKSLLIDVVLGVGHTVVVFKTQCERTTR